nr:immunoglobulin heavy chain junction region [Mus musculus]
CARRTTVVARDFDYW